MWNNKLILQPGIWDGWFDSVRYRNAHFSGQSEAIQKYFCAICNDDLDAKSTRWVGSI